MKRRNLMITRLIAISICTSVLNTEIAKAEVTTSSNSVLKSVSISGTEEVGHTLKSKVKYDGTKPSLQYKWQRASKKDGDYSDISGADDDDYRLKNSDNNKYIKLIITATINGQVYTVEDRTSKIDLDTSDDEEDVTNSSARETSSDDSRNNYTSGSTTNNSVNNTSANTSGSLATGTFTNPSGIPISGWISSNGGKWYYLDSNGVAKVGWVNVNSNWYYLSPNPDQNRATMKTGWVQDSGNWYYLNSSGAMVSNTTIDGYKIGSDGRLIG